MPFPRCSGILLHPTSFPGRFGIGDLGVEAYQFVDFLARSRQQLWQILPLGPTGYGNSPYMSFSTMAGNPLLISPDTLRKNGLLVEEDFWHLPEFSLDSVDFEAVIAWKMPILRKAAENFTHQAKSKHRKAFEKFCLDKAVWLDDYALFMAILQQQKGAIWTEWPAELRDRNPKALAQTSKALAAEIHFHKFLQFELFWQWGELKAYANDKNIQIVGDVPIYVAYNSADVWAHRSVFQLDPKTGEPINVAGVPPDYFSATGQLWGNPLYDWQYLEDTQFHWWVERIREILLHVDLVRIDHFRGLEAYWAVPAKEKTAINGKWIKAPGEALFENINQALGDLPIIAEDLGIITPEVEALRDKFGFPGMKILQFAFGSDSGNAYLPYNVDWNSVIYTGTHDNNTTLGWFYDDANDYEKERILRYLGKQGEYGVSWDFIRLALASRANQSIFPLQDVFSLGSNARMNMPGKAEGNWAWRYRKEALTDEYSDRLRDMVEIYGRFHHT